MSGFGWSAGDVVLAVKLIAKITKALKETGGARDDYQQSVQFLSGLETTLKNLAAAGTGLPQSAAAQETIRQTEKIVGVLAPLLRDVRRFESSLGAGASRSRASQTASRLRWSFRQAKAVEDLEERISVPLATVNANIGMQILELINTVQANLPVFICDALSARIDATISNHLSAGLKPVSRAINAQASASTQMVRNLATTQALQLDAQQALRSSLTENMARFQTEVRLLQASVEGNSAVLTRVETALFSKIDSTCGSKQLASPRERISYSLLALTHAINELLLAFLELVWPLLLLLLHKIQTAGSHLTRLLISDSIIFEDALGRTRYLPFEFFQHWDVFLPYLHKTFEQVPGFYQLTRRRFHLVDSRAGTIIDPQVWTASVRPGSRLSMAMVVFKISSTKHACPHCGGTQMWTGPDTFAICSTCDGNYRFFEPGIRRYITPSDGYYSHGLSALRASNEANDIPQWPNLTFPTLQSSVARIVEVPKHAALTQSRVFKKVDILFVNDPGRTVAILEELLDLVREFEHSREFLDQDTESALRQFIRLVRFELQQPINFFDFKSWYMDDCSRSIDDLQSWVDNPWASPLSYEGSPLICTWFRFSCRAFASSLRQDIVNRNRTNGYGTIVVLVKTLTGKIVMLRVQSHTTVSEIKTMLRDIDGLPTSFQCLIYRSKKLEDHCCVSDYNVSTEYYIHLVLTYRVGNSGHYYDQPLPKWLLYDGERPPSNNEVSQP